MSPAIRYFPWLRGHTVDRASSSIRSICSRTTTPYYKRANLLNQRARPPCRSILAKDADVLPGTLKVVLSVACRSSQAESVQTQTQTQMQNDLSLRGLMSSTQPRRRGAGSSCEQASSEAVCPFLRETSADERATEGSAQCTKQSSERLDVGEGL